VVVELKYGGTLEGRIIDSDDSTVTLEVPLDGDRTRRAVLRRSDIRFLEGSDTVGTPGEVSPADSMHAEQDSVLQYRNVIGGGIALRRASSSSPFATRDSRLEFAYEFTSVPKVWSEDKQTRLAAGITPTTYLSIVSETDPYGEAPLLGSLEYIFYGHQIRPRVVVGGGFILATHGADGSLDINRQYIFAGTADYFPSETIRFRETAGAGWMTTDDGSPEDTSGTARAIIHMQHRFDFAIGNANVFGAAIPIAYTHTLQCQYIDTFGFNLQFRNGIEYAPERRYSMTIFIPLYFEFPSEEDSRFAAGFGAELAVYATPQLTLQLRYQERGGLGKYDTSARSSAVLVFWKF